MDYFHQMWHIVVYRQGVHRVEGNAHVQHRQGVMDCVLHSEVGYRHQGEGDMAPGTVLEGNTLGGRGTGEGMDHTVHNTDHNQRVGVVGRANVVGEVGWIARRNMLFLVT